MAGIDRFVRGSWEDLQQLHRHLQELAPESTDEDVRPFGIREGRFAIDLIGSRTPRVVRISYNSYMDEVYGIDESGERFSVKVTRS